MVEDVRSEVWLRVGGNHVGKSSRSFVVVAEAVQGGQGLARQDNIPRRRNPNLLLRWTHCQSLPTRARAFSE
jgi:hypothetical protein